MLCSNGHEQPAGAERFCIYCGVELKRTSAKTSAQRDKQTVAPTKTEQQASGQSRTQKQQLVPPQTPKQQIAKPQPYQPLPSCKTCGGDGRRLNPKAVICEECNWLRPLVDGYQLNTSSFEWAADGKAMSVLRSITPLQLAAKTVSEKVGRRWIESTFNGVLLGPKQLPEIYGQAVRAARLLGMTHMPDVYLSGERAWDCLTFGTDKDSFIVIGSALAGSFRGPDMLFLLAREIGHCRAGHALWKSVIRFFLGEQGPAKGFMSHGLLAAVISPTALLTGAMEMPLLAWARQAEITADRAGLLAVGDEQVARRVLLTWTLKSAFMFRQINIDAWLEQQSEIDDGYSKLTELTTTSTPYITPRLQLLTEFAKSRELKYWQKYISDSIARGKAKTQPSLAATPAENVVRIKCASCQTPMRIPRSVLEGKDVLPVKCPNTKCGKITRLKKQVKAAIPKQTKAAKNPTVTKKRGAGEDGRLARKKAKRNVEELNVVD